MKGSSTRHPPPPPSQELGGEIRQKEESREQQDEEEEKGMDRGGSTTNNKPLLPDSLQCFTAEEILKYDKYEASYASYLRAKFFSDKDIYGGDIFDLAITIGDEPIKASRWSPTRSYADPQQGFIDIGHVVTPGEEMPSASGVESSAHVSNGNLTPTKKSS